MIDKSTNNTNSWQWDFGDNLGYSTAQNPSYTYPEEVSQYQIFLKVRNAAGCADSIYKILNIVDDHWIYVPNSFTPNSDAKNDRFIIDHYGVLEQSFSINIFNRLNELVYSSNNVDELNKENGWDGKHLFKGFDLPSGT